MSFEINIKNKKGETLKIKTKLNQKKSTIKEDSFNRIKLLEPIKCTFSKCTGQLCPTLICCTAPLQYQGLAVPIPNTQELHWRCSNQQFHKSLCQHDWEIRSNWPFKPFKICDICSKTEK